MENTHQEDTLLQRSVYYGAVLGIALWVIWIGWMPFIQVSFSWLNVPVCCTCLDSIFLQCPPSQVIISASSVTTTICHTFSEYNTAATIYVIGPMSLTLIFRVFRTIKADMIWTVQKKMVLIILLMTQYSTMIVVRHDTIQGTWHYFFTAMTFVFSFCTTT